MFEIGNKVRIKYPQDSFFFNRHGIVSDVTKIHAKVIFEDPEIETRRPFYFIFSLLEKLNED